MLRNNPRQIIPPLTWEWDFPAVRALCIDTLTSRQYLACLAANLLLTLPIILFVNLYIDDMQRSMAGNLSWGDVGRPLADALFSFINFGTPAVAVAPLLQLLSVVIGSLTAVLIARTHGIRSPLWSALGTLPLLGNPYGLENLSYGFDCLSMTASVTLAVVAATIIQLSRSIKILACAIALMLASLFLYQPGACAFLPFALMLVIGHRIGRLALPLMHITTTIRLFRILGCYVGALGAYRLTLTFFQSSLSQYAADNSQTLALSPYVGGTILANALGYWQLIADDWGQRTYTWVPLALFIAYALTIWLQSLNASAHNPGPLAASARSVLLLACLPIIFLISPGAMLLLKSPHPELPRTLLYVGPLLSAVTCQVIGNAARINKLRQVSRICRTVSLFPVATLAWLLLLFSFAYGQAFNAQTQFEQGRISRLMYGITKLQSQRPEKQIRKLRINGIMPPSPVLINTQAKFPLIGRLVPRLINNDWYWGHKQLQIYGLNPEIAKVDAGLIPSFQCKQVSTSHCTSEYGLEFVDDTLYILIR